MNMMAMQQQSYVRLYVGNLSFDTTQIDLWDLFRGAAGQSGKASPIQVQIQFSPEGLTKGWALVDFPDADSAEFCIQVFNGFEFGDRVLNGGLTGAMGAVRTLSVREHQCSVEWRLGILRRRLCAGKRHLGCTC